MAFTERFEEALAYAARLHREQVRKGGELPYIGHLLGVASMVIDEGGSEDQAIAALLHDAAEDQGGEATLTEIERRFGPRVARMVSGCSDTTETPKPPWRRRKEAYVRHLSSASPDVLMVSLADKLYNARSILLDYQREGDRVWERFNADRAEQLWYYRALADTFTALGDKVPRHLAAELDRIVTELERAGPTGPAAGR